MVDWWIDGSADYLLWSFYCSTKGDLFSWQVGAYIARVRLREKHQENLQRKLAELKEEQGIKDEEERLLMPPPPPLPIASGSGTASVPLPAAEPLATESSHEDFQTDEEQQRIQEYTSGQYSPTYIPFGDIDVQVELVEVEDDLRRLQMSRSQLARTGSSALLTNEDHVFEREAKKGMGGDEAQFSVETPLEQPTYVWSDKYRPRKPRYFNRVHTGFEWNKYNQTHYDMDNPPPKVVQGYKFNIFYPDLISKTSEPKYTIKPCEDNRDFSILRVSAGPPYEDIAFKIVSREWEYSQKRGYRCWFNNNIFQLWFHFKRYRYRRWTWVEGGGKGGGVASSLLQIGTSTGHWWFRNFFGVFFLTIPIIPKWTSLFECFVVSVICGIFIAESSWNSMFGEKNENFPLWTMQLFQ